MNDITLLNYCLAGSSFRAIETHEKNGKLDGTIIALKIEEAVLDINTMTISLSISTDMEKSINPPYEFHVLAIGSARFQAVETDHDAAMLMIALSQLLVGAMRQYIASNTSMFAWDRFNLGFINIQIQKDIVEQMMENRRKAPTNIEKPKAKIKINKKRTPPIK